MKSHQQTTELLVCMFKLLATYFSNMINLNPGLSRPARILLMHIGKLRIQLRAVAFLRICPPCKENVHT